MLSVKDISYKAGDKNILQNVSAEFETGKFNLIIGPNGAGKSTLIKIMSYPTSHASGEVFYNGINIRQLSLSNLAKMRAVLSQNTEIAFPLSVMEVVMLGRHPHFTGKPSDKDHAACKEAVQFFDLWELKDRNFLTLSGGEKQRVHFARTLAQIWFSDETKERYLILDEPLTFLDVHYQFEFMQKIRELLKQGQLTVIGVLHDLNLAAKFADNILLLHDGKIFATGNRNKVLTKENIKSVYQIEPRIFEQDQEIFLFF